MPDKKPPISLFAKIRFILLIIFLAIICIGGAELLVLRSQNPSLYHKITTPVKEAAVYAAKKTKSACIYGYHRIIDGYEWLSVKADEIEKSVQKAEADLIYAMHQSQKASEQSQDKKPDKVSDPIITEKIYVDGRETLTGGVIPITYFCQTDPAWASLSYGTDDIGTYGCGPTAMAMIIESFGKYDTDPAQMASWCADNGYWAKQSGSYHSIVSGTASAFGLKCESASLLTSDEIRTRLAGGQLAIALMGAGHFTNSGHFIILRGVTLSGEILVADPISRERSLTLWDAELIINELSKSRSAGAPLWFIYP